MDRITTEEKITQDMGSARVIDDLRQGQLDTENSKAQSQRVLLKIDSVVMPLIAVAMTLAFLDKVSGSDNFFRLGMTGSYYFLERTCICSRIWLKNRHASGWPAV